MGQWSDIDSSRLHRYQVWKEAWESGLYREGGEPVYPRSDADPEQIKRDDERARHVYAEITARHAARRAMRWWNVPLLSESLRARHHSANRPSVSERSFQASESSPWPTPRRQRPLGNGLLNKTMRKSKSTKILQASVDGAANCESHHGQSYAATENYGALPSSYRRLRKARSMHTTGHHDTPFQESPLSNRFLSGRPLRSVTSSAAIPTHNLRVRLKRSLSLLRPRSTFNLRRRANEERDSHEEGLLTARAHFIDSNDPRVQERSSAPLQAKLENEHRSPRNGGRTSHVAESEPTPTAANGGIQLTPSCSERRSLSASVRERLRKALRKTVKAKEHMPAQRLEAHRSYYGELGDDLGTLGGFDAYCIDEQGQNVRKSIYRPTTPEYDTSEDLDKVQPFLRSTTSRESLHSTARSRVTSWTNSSMTGSVGLRSGLIEPNRLSIIKEDGGPHQPSSSAGRHIGGVEVFHEPLQRFTNDGLALPSVDSQRVYSALIKRISQEEIEMERTRVALEAINQDRDQATRESFDEIPTIRAVHSDSSLATVAPDNQHGQFSSGSSTWPQSEDGRTAEQDPEMADRRKERLTIEEAHSSFFPFSDERNPGAPSPFKKLLKERRHQGRSSTLGGSTSLDGVSVIVSRRPSRSVMNRPRFGMSSDSVYSRTTNGGSNEQYRSPIGSSEGLLFPPEADLCEAGMATVLDTSCSELAAGHWDHFPAIKVSGSEWNPWSDTLNTIQARKECTNGSDLREQGQVKSEASSKKITEKRVGRELKPMNIDGTDLRPPLLDVKYTLIGGTPKPKVVMEARQAHTRLHPKGSVDALSSISNLAEDGSRTSETLRKLSPGNLARRLREKKSQLLSRHHATHDKENVPADRAGSPPLSTPGKLHIEFRNGSSTGRLRKKGSETAFNCQSGLHSTPKSAALSISTTPSRLEESPSENAKSHLVARLSRPFNMDVPPHNRPFDSMYLGKRTTGHPDTLGNFRLSVAPQVPEALQGAEPTALPTESSTVGRSTSKMMGLFTSKRMVSNFLKSRRGERSTSEGGQSLSGGSPAFI